MDFAIPADLQAYLDELDAFIDAEIRPIVAPYILQAALKRFSAHLSVLRNQPLTTRRYMWKVAY